MWCIDHTWGRVDLQCPLLQKRTGFYDEISGHSVHNPSKVTWGTCAGMIYISQQLSNEANWSRR
nr:ADM_HP1_G0006240.mRNA.1.CDS.1 [Saccharomyces cerevisiae]